jgi:hypothetical protein
VIPVSFPRPETPDPTPEPLLTTWPIPADSMNEWAILL